MVEHDFSCLQVDYADQEQSQILLSLLQMYAKDPMGGGSAIDDKLAEKLVDEMAKRDYMFSVLAFDTKSHAPLGFANCIESFSTFKCRPVVNIHDFAVVPSARGKGVSQALINTISDIAKKRGACKLTLEVLEGNESAQKAYLKAGFKGYELDPEMGRALFWEKPLLD
jgi:GNAT superfamily N-acetyltransferase